MVGYRAGMSQNGKMLLNAATWVAVTVGVLAGMITVTALGNDCGTVFFPSEPLLAGRFEVAACADARSARAPLVWIPLVIGAGLGVWRLGQSRRGVRSQPDEG